MSSSACLLAVLLVGYFLGQFSEGFRDEMINQHMRFRKIFFPSSKGLEYIIQVKTANHRAAATDANLFIDIHGSKATASNVKLGNFMTFNDFQSGKTDKFKVKLRDLGEIRKITLGHNNIGRRPNWYLDRILIKARDGRQYKFICNCVITELKSLFPEGKNTTQIQAPGGCTGIFSDASHCWPFNDETAEESPDLRGGSHAELEDGARIADSVARIKVASTLEKGSWINMGKFKGKCISNPNLCRQGITMMFWARIERTAITSMPRTPQYVLSSGGTDRRSQGFSFFHKNNTYVLQVTNGRKKWRQEIPFSNIPSNAWFCFAFTWSKAQGMEHFINGELDGQPIRRPVNAAIRHVNRFHSLRISKSNSNNKMEEMLPMKIDQFVTWNKILSRKQIKEAFKEGGGLPLNNGYVPNLQACQPTPCFNGGTCKIDVDEPRGYRCICPEGYAGLQCELNEEGPTQGASTSAPTTAVLTTALPRTSLTTKQGSTMVPTSSPQSTTKGPNTQTTTSSGPTTTGGPSTAASSTPAVPTSAPPITAVGSAKKPSSKGPFTTQGGTKTPTAGGIMTTTPTSAGVSPKKPQVGGVTTVPPTSAGVTTNETPTTASPSTGVSTTAGGSTKKPKPGGVTTAPPTSAGATTNGPPTTATPLTGGPTTAGGSTKKPKPIGVTTAPPTSAGVTTNGPPTTATPLTGGPTTAGESTKKPKPIGVTTAPPTSAGVTTNGPPTTATPLTEGPTTAGGSTKKPKPIGVTTAPPTSAGVTTNGPPTTATPLTEGPTTAGGSTKKPKPIGVTTAPPTSAGVTTNGPPTTAAPSTGGPTTAVGSTKKPKPISVTTAPPTSAGVSTQEPPTTASPSTVVPTTAAGSTKKPKASGIKTTLPTSSSGPTTVEPTSPGSSVSMPTASGPSTKAPTTARGSTGGSTPAGTAGGSSRKPTTEGVSTGPTTPMKAGKPPLKPVVIQIEIKIVIHNVIAEIDNFRRLHQSPDVKPSEKLNNAADRWAKKIAAEGVERIDPNSNYGQLVCSHKAGGNIAKACVVKWYGAIKFFDWSNPKLTVKASPFTQLVWKKNNAIGVGVASGGGGLKKQNVGGKNYIVVLFEPGQSDADNIKENVLAATGISEPAPGAACPKGYSKVPQGARSCFKVNKTPLTWNDAIYGCALDNGTLASLQSKEEVDLVVSLIKASDISEAWIGLHDSSNEGKYVWLDGSPIPFSEWLQGEPNGARSENCIVQSKGNFMSGWADRPCAEMKAFTCEAPLPGYTTYKLSFILTEPRSHPYLNTAYAKSLYPGAYSMCSPYIKSGNELLRETIIRYFQTKNLFVQPIVNTIRCMTNGSSLVEVVLKLGPGDASEAIKSLEVSIQENDGVLDLASGAKAKLVSVEIISPGTSYCPVQCATTTCHPGCDQICCTQSTAGQYQPQIPFQQPLQQQYQQQYQRPYQQPQQPYQPQYQLQPYQRPPSNNNEGLWQCPVACTRSGNHCPSYCAPRCCKRRLRIRIHRF